MERDVKKILKKFLRLENSSSLGKLNTFENLEKKVIELNNFKELMKVFNWKEDPILNRPDMYDFDYVEDANERRVRDSESIATVVHNLYPDTVVEIGTANGMGTILLAENASKGTIFTINIPPDEIISGEGGHSTTAAIEIENIGIEYKKRDYKNVRQIYANTAKWVPEMERINVAFIDGCHDTWFVVNDTKKVLEKMKPGDFILWHDFNLDLVKKYYWINDVVLGVEQLYREGYLKGRIFHIRDSWIGIYQIV
jgi:cephalosporin hydroxylase